MASNKIAPDNIPSKTSSLGATLATIAPFLEENKIFQKVELYRTAIVSIVDMGKDIMMILKFHNSSRGSYANATLACVSTNLFLQSLHRIKSRNLPQPFPDEVVQPRGQGFIRLLLSTKGTSFAIAILLAEMALYYVIKFMRGDIWYWAPMNSPTKRIFNIVLNVFLIKLAVDWSLVVQFRHPQEVGGAYFTFSIVVTMAIGLLSLIFFEESNNS
ncbi:hypothetical protein TrLO_g519 [Triparma laevis f. longispina]|nr:hypothetical protein TrLO_g519 [Triparma laevis f. longispina]